MEKNKPKENENPKSEQENQNKKADVIENENIIKVKDLFKLKFEIKKGIFEDIDGLNKLLSKKVNIFYEKMELLELISSGSSGVVYTGRIKYKEKERYYAFKFLYDKNDYTEQLIHQKLKHKNIPKVIRIESLQDYEFMVIEYAELGNIEKVKSKFLKTESSLSEPLLLYITGGILEALKYIHTNKKIIHMDIKPENILIDNIAMIKLTDFSVSIDYGSAKDYIDLPMSGTSYYMSPEVLKKERILVSEASKIDIYSLGVLLYHLAFYYYPYKLNLVKSDNFAQILKNINENDLKFPKNSRYSKTFINFVSNCLNKDIKKRYNIYQAMKDTWIKGYQILLDEKEKLYNNHFFLHYLQKELYMDKIKFIK